MLAASTRCEAVTANHAATRIGPTSVPEGASAASTRDPARNSDRPPPRASPSADAARGTTAQRQAEPDRRADEQRGEHVVERPQAAVAAATGHEEVRIGLARHDRSPPGLRFAGPDPGREGHGDPQVQRRCRGHAHHLAGAVEPQRTTESALRCPGRSDDRARVAVARGVGCHRPRALVESVRSNEARGPRGRGAPARGRHLGPQFGRA